MTSPLSHITDDQWRTLSPRQLSVLTGRSLAAVHQWRRSHGKPRGPRSPGSGRPPKVDVGKFDPDYSDQWNAKKMRCTPQRVGQIRRALYAGAGNDEPDDFC